MRAHFGSIAAGFRIAVLLSLSTPWAAFAKDLTIADLRARLPIGALGKPLGSRVKVTATFPSRVMLLENPIEISVVDGKPLATPLFITVKGEFQLKQGVTYHLEGYEAGEFSGPASWIEPERQQQPFQYRPHFVVTAVLEPSQN